MREDRERVTTGKPGRSLPAAPVEEAPRGTRKALVESQIVERATQLFAERGFAGTSLQDVADAMGLTRPALYHYFSSKEDLLSRLVSDATEGPAEELREIRCRVGAPVTERLHAMATAIALLQASHPARFRALIRSEAELPQPLTRTYQEGRRRVLREFTAVIDEGVRSGELRSVEPRTAALGVIGLCNWVAWWHHPTGEQADRDVARAMADMAVAAVASTDDRAVEGDGAARALRLLKDDVAALERLLLPDQAP